MQCSTRADAFFSPSYQLRIESLPNFTWALNYTGVLFAILVGLLQAHHGHSLVNNAIYKALSKDMP